MDRNNTYRIFYLSERENSKWRKNLEIPDSFGLVVADWFEANNYKDFSELEPENKIKIFYWDIKIFSLMLYTAINNAVFITYENPKREKKEYFQEQLKQFENEMRIRFENLNKLFGNIQKNNYKSKSYDFFKQFQPWNRIVYQKVNCICPSYIILFILIVSLIISNLIVVYHNWNMLNFSILGITNSAFY